MRIPSLDMSQVRDAIRICRFDIHSDADDILYGANDIGENCDNYKRGKCMVDKKRCEFIKYVKSGGNT